jgi:hypothetical protein
VALVWRLLGLVTLALGGLVAFVGVSADGLGVVERTAILGGAALLIWAAVRLQRRPA